MSRGDAEAQRILFSAASASPREISALIIVAAGAPSAQRTLRDGAAPVGSAVRTSDLVVTEMAGMMIEAEISSSP